MGLHARHHDSLPQALAVFGDHLDWLAHTRHRLLLLLSALLPALEAEFGWVAAELDHQKMELSA